MASTCLLRQSLKEYSDNQYNQNMMLRTCLHLSKAIQDLGTRLMSLHSLPRINNITASGVLVVGQQEWRLFKMLSKKRKMMMSKVFLQCPQIFFEKARYKDWSDDGLVTSSR